MAANINFSIVKLFHSRSESLDFHRGFAKCWCHYIIKPTGKPWPVVKNPKVLLRHGAMASKGIVGWTDVDLSPEGQAQAGWVKGDDGDDGVASFCSRNLEGILEKKRRQVYIVYSLTHLIWLE